MMPDYRPYVPKPGDPYPSFAFLLWNGESAVSVRTVTMLIRQPRKEGDPDAR